MLQPKRLSDFLPPFLVKLVCRSAVVWKGNYPSWKEASSNCEGYDQPKILERVKAAALKVRNGEAAYERDSVVFDHIEYDWQVLSGLLRSALDNEGQLHVLDFGGSLGSSYYQNRHFLSCTRALTWSVVEQAHFVDCGKEHFEDNTLKFYLNVEECLKERKPNVLLLSSVIQYLDEPGKWMQFFSEFNFPYIIVDLTGIWQNPTRITIQHIHPCIYPASYPCWIFNEDEFLSFFPASYSVVSFSASYFGENLSAEKEEFNYKCLILEHNR